ncbi:hypothetical protein ZWY2020_035120 [Hordeum vulgare]|nr:hypothetical protein ZWY2020_035120 [Hordeum vulgare]
MAFMNVRLQDLGPNSISNLCQFQVFCEAYLRMEPSVPLFWYFFHLNRQTEFHNGPSLELGGVNVQRRRDSPFPSLAMPSHPKGWGESWFYCQETSRVGENKLLGYREDRLPTNFKLPNKLTIEEESDFIPVLSELRSSTNNDLTGVDLIRCWVEWRILPLCHRDGLMCEFDDTLDHPQCYFRTAQTESDIVTIIKKLTGEPAGKCSQIGLKPFCKINPAPKKGDKFWSKKPKKPSMKQARPPPKKKTKGKGKAAVTEPSEADESQVGDAPSENEDNENQEDSVESLNAPLSSFEHSEEKKAGSTPIIISEPIKEPAPIQDNPNQDKTEDQVDLPSSPKETMDAPKPPSPLTTTEDPDVIITGTSFSKPATAVLSKHVSSSSQTVPEYELSKAKLSQYEHLEFKELCSGFASRLEASYEMEKSLLRMLKNKHEESLIQTESTIGDLKKSLSDQQDARAKSEEKYRLVLAEMEKLKADLKRLKLTKMF